MLTHILNYNSLSHTNIYNFFLYTFPLKFTCKKISNIFKCRIKCCVLLFLATPYIQNIIPYILTIFNHCLNKLNLKNISYYLVLFIYNRRTRTITFFIFKIYKLLYSFIILAKLF